jgi:hypothetical protein
MAGNSLWLRQMGTSSRNPDWSAFIAPGGEFHKERGPVFFLYTAVFILFLEIWGTDTSTTLLGYWNKKAEKL